MDQPKLRSILLYKQWLETISTSTLPKLISTVVQFTGRRKHERATRSATVEGFPRKTSEPMVAARMESDAKRRQRTEDKQQENARLFSEDPRQSIALVTLRTKLCISHGLLLNELLHMIYKVLCVHH